MQSALSAWLEAQGINERDAAKRCGELGLELVFYALLDGSQTLPSLALKIGRALGMDEEAVKPLAHPLDRRKWAADKKRGKDDGKLTCQPIELKEDWYTQLRYARLPRSQRTPLKRRTDGPPLNAEIGRVDARAVENIRLEKGISREEAGRRWRGTADDQGGVDPRNLWNQALWRMTRKPVITEMTAQRLERVLGVKRERFMEG